MDPRIIRTLAAVRPATLLVLADRGYAAFTVEAVADASGVAKSTIYRHWPTKLALIADALETLNEQPQPDIDAGGAHARVRILIEHLATAFEDSVLSDCIPALIEAAERHPEIASFLHGYSARRRQTLVETIAHGIDTGELSEHLDPELAALALAGPIIYHRTMTPAPLQPDEAARLVEMILGPQDLP